MFSPDARMSARHRGRVAASPSPAGAHHDRDPGVRPGRAGSGAVAGRAHRCRRADIAEALIDAALRDQNRDALTTTDEVIRASEVLMEIGELVRVAARSEKVRAITYRALHAAV